MKEEIMQCPMCRLGLPCAENDKLTPPQNQDWEARGWTSPPTDLEDLRLGYEETMEAENESDCFTVRKSELETYIRALLTRDRAERKAELLEKLPKGTHCDICFKLGGRAQCSDCPNTSWKNIRRIIEETL